MIRWCPIKVFEIHCHNMFVSENNWHILVGHLGLISSFVIAMSHLNVFGAQEFRTFPMEHLAGETSTVVRLKEHQCFFESGSKGIQRCTNLQTWTPLPTNP